MDDFQVNGMPFLCRFVHIRASGIQKRTEQKRNRTPSSGGVLSVPDVVFFRPVLAGSHAAFVAGLYFLRGQSVVFLFELFRVFAHLCEDAAGLL